MNEKTFRTLEYDKIINMLADCCISKPGKEMAMELKPKTDLLEISDCQKETSDAYNMVTKKGNIPLGGIKDIRDGLKRVAISAILSIEELMNISSFLYVTKKIKNYCKTENKEIVYEYLDPLFELIVTLPALESELNRCIVSETEIADDATPELRSIRREMKVSSDKIRDTLNSIIHSSTYKTMLQDPVVTIRSGRYCVPVKSEYKTSFNGMVHDQSGSGSTLFIEPMSVVELNNKVKELEAREKAEIEKVLYMLSNLVANDLDILTSNLEIITKLDLIFGKANLSINMMASEPIFNDNGYINIKKGRHPLLNSKTVVPTNIYLGKDFNILLITGPNTGGKTVALKTLGLFTLMGQSGLHIPAFDHSELAVFDNVFSDIGDEQSIEQSLSTFSSHMTNIVSILKDVTPKSLVLFDELGAGTDPTEGAALAMSILTHLHSMDIRAAVTTHYSELKVFALSTDGIMNASCEFNVETLRPTYKLLIGIPGKSNAFAISKRLGLSDDIIASAKEFLSKEDMKFEDVITDLEISRLSVEAEKQRAESYRIETERMKRDFEQQKEKLEEQKEKILLKAREDARAILLKSKDEADFIIKEMSRLSKEQANFNAVSKKRQELNERLAETNEKLGMPKTSKKGETPKDLKEGDRVYVISLNQKAIVLNRPSANGDVMVQAGLMKIKVNIKDLWIDTDKPKEDEQKKVSRGSLGKAMHIKNEIDLRGYLVDDALETLGKYLDDAFLSNISTCTVIHGKGTGALRQAVTKYLKNHPHVKSHRLGVFGEGETGVTIVEFK